VSHNTYAENCESMRRRIPPPYNTTGKQQRENIFDKEDKQFYLEPLQRYKDKYKIKILAYCLMGNHAHILAIPEKEISLARGIGGTNPLYTQYINRKYNRSGRLWPNRFFSSIVEEEPFLWAVIRYIEQNPVRAKLVKKAEDYQWSSEKAHILDIRDDMLSKESWFDEKEVKLSMEFLNKDDKEINAAIRRATSTGRPLGVKDL